MTIKASKTQHSSVHLGASRVRFLKMLVFWTLLGILVAFHTTSDASDASRQSGKPGHENNPLLSILRFFEAIRERFQAPDSEAQKRWESEWERRIEEEKKKEEELRRRRRAEARRRWKAEARRRREEQRKEREARLRKEEEEARTPGYYEKKYGEEGIHHKNAIRERVMRQIRAEREERAARREEEEEEEEEREERAGLHEAELPGPGCECLTRQIARKEEEKIYDDIYEGKREETGEEEIRKEALDRARYYLRDPAQQDEDEERRQQERFRFRVADWKREEAERIKSGYYDKKYGEEGIHHKNAIRERVMREVKAERSEREARRKEEEAERIKSGYYEKKYGKEGMYHKRAIHERLTRNIAKEEEEKIYDAIYEGRREATGEEDIRKEAFDRAYFQFFIYGGEKDERGYKYIDWGYRRGKGKHQGQ